MSAMSFRQAMTEERVLALAGLFQGVGLACQFAREGRCDETALDASLASILRREAPSVAAVYGGVAGVRLGLRQLIAQLDGRERDFTLTRMAVAVLRLERSLARHGTVLERLRQGLEAAQVQAAELGHDAAEVIARLDALYTATLSTLQPRILVGGDPALLKQPAVVMRIRASLLAAIRSAVLWRQLGGRRWQLLLHRRRCCMLARGLLTGAILDRG